MSMFVNFLVAQQLYIPLRLYFSFLFFLFFCPSMVLSIKDSGQISQNKVNKTKPKQTWTTKPNKTQPYQTIQTKQKLTKPNQTKTKPNSVILNQKLHQSKINKQS